MATIPLLKGQQVAPAPLPAQQVSTNVPDAGTGAFGQGLQQFGNALSAVQAEQERKAREEKAKTDDIAVNAAATAAIRDRIDATDAYGQLGGQDALAASDAAEAAYVKSLQDRRAALANEEQRAQFDAQAGAQSNTFHAFVRDRVTGERIKLDDTGMEDFQAAQIDSVGRAAMAGQLKGGMVASAANDLIDKWTSWAGRNAPRLGGMEAAKKIATDKITAGLSALHAAAIDGLIAKGDDQAAVAYFQRNRGELTAKALAQYLPAVTKAAEEGEVARVSAAAFAAHSDPNAVASDGTRADGTRKGYGFLGELPHEGGTTSTEISIGIEMHGKEVEIPTLVPGLTQEEIDYLLTDAGTQGVATDDSAIAKSIRGKAIAHAKERIAQGLSPFHDDGQPQTWADLEKAGMAEIDATLKDPKQNKTAKDALHDLYSRRAALDKQQQAESFEGFKRRVAAGESIKDLAATPEFRTGITTEQQEGVKTYARLLATEAARDGDPAVYQKMLDGLSGPDATFDPDAGVAIEVAHARGQLSDDMHSSLKAVWDAQKTLAGAGAATDTAQRERAAKLAKGVQSDLAIQTNAVTSLWGEKADKSPDALAFRSQMDAIVQADKLRLGRELSSTEVQAIADTMVSQSWIDTSSQFNPLSTFKHFYELNYDEIPDEDVKRVLLQFGAEGRTQVTQEMVRERYLSDLAGVGLADASSP